jgi:23S rRNA (adenine2503-C2)-methyltransferase
VSPVDHPSAARVDPYALGRQGLGELLSDEPSYRVEQVHAWLVRGVEDPADMTDLPKALRARLAARFAPPATLLRHRTADDHRTHKVLLGMADGEAIESVLMCYPAGGGLGPGEPAIDHAELAGGRARATVCISTQAGCAMGCPFCATGQAGYRRQLSLGEIVRQVTVVQRLLVTGGIDVPGAPDHVTNVVFMGMGEPLANLEPTVEAVRWLHDPEGFDLSARAITVSTVGLVPGIRRLTRLGLPITLAVSLHAPNDVLRDDLVPVNRQHPLGELMAACREYRDTTGRRLTFEYVLIDGVNDALDHAEELASLVRPLRAHVNLIPMNPTPAVPWRAPAVEHQRAFAGVLETAGVPTTIRHNRGGDIDAACGQLYAEYAMASGRTLPQAVGAAERLARPGGSGGRRSGGSDGTTT